MDREKSHSLQNFATQIKLGILNWSALKIMLGSYVSIALKNCQFTYYLPKGIIKLSYPIHTHVQRDNFYELAIISPNTVIEHAPAQGEVGITISVRIYLL